jgi:spore maturation protein CgeD
MPKVSVLLTVYNKPQWLKECIDSVINQTYENWELIILEDNSPEPMVQEILSSYADHRIKIYTSNISEEDRYKTTRYASLINLGVFQIATGDYITYLTDDDFYYPNRLESMIKALEDESIDIVYGSQRSIQPNGTTIEVRDTQGILDVAYNIVDHNSVMHRTQLFYDVGGWPDNPEYWAGADAYFWNRITDAGHKFYPVEGGPYEAKRYHGDSVQYLVHNGRFFPNE